MGDHTLPDRPDAAHKMEIPLFLTETADTRTQPLLLLDFTEYVGAHYVRHGKTRLRQGTSPTKQPGQFKSRDSCQKNAPRPGDLGHWRGIEQSRRRQAG